MECVQKWDLFNTSSLQNPLTGLLCDSEGADGHLGDVEDPEVVGDGSDDDGGLVTVTGLLHVTGQTGDGERRAVDLAHEQALEHGLVEVRVGAARQEAVELHQELKVHVLRLGRLAVLDLVAPASLDIDALRIREERMGGGRVR